MRAFVASAAPDKMLRSPVFQRRPRQPSARSGSPAPASGSGADVGVGGMAKAFHRRAELHADPGILFPGQYRRLLHYACTSTARCVAGCRCSHAEVAPPRSRTPIERLFTRAILGQLPRRASSVHVPALRYRPPETASAASARVAALISSGSMSAWGISMCCGWRRRAGRRLDAMVLHHGSDATRVQRPVLLARCHRRSTSHQTQA